MTIDLETELESDESHFVIDGVSWETYELLLRDLQSSGQRKRVTYNDGRMVIVSPLFKHERWKKLLGRFVEAITQERDIPIVSAGSTTWKRKKQGKGLEPDECFYIQNESAMRGRLEVNLKLDPPPDLAIEVDLRPYLKNKLNAYAGLGVPEVWCYDGVEVEIFVLGPDGDYLKADESAALPFLAAGDLGRFLGLATEKPENAIILEVRKWAREQKS